MVTGAARGIGAAIARRFAADGDRVVVVDVPVAGESLARVANEIRGTALQLDITLPEAGERIAAHVVGRYGSDAKIGALVHCAGILRDKMLANLDEIRWAAVLHVNLAAQLRINDVLLDPATGGGVADGGRIVGVASTSGWAGNKGQTNYAASKAGVMGMVRALAVQLADRGIAVNAVAPGFIETDMTASIPVIDREILPAQFQPAAGRQAGRRCRGDRVPGRPRHADERPGATGMRPADRGALRVHVVEL